MSNEKPIYSICICNYNMADTIERALKSILDQIDSRFEIVIADDGSSDDSVQVIKMLQEGRDDIRLLEFERDKNRRLGFTRNITIEEARGKYVLLHLDCDDIYAPYLKDFVAAFHQIEDAVGCDILVSGKHINMSKRDFLLAHGPYENMMRGEDRNLWVRMASINAYIPLDHVDFCTRLPKVMKRRYLRTICNTWDHLQNDFRSGASFKNFVVYETIKAMKFLGWKLRVLRMTLAPFAFLCAKFKKPYAPPPENMDTPEKFAQYRDKTKGKLEEILGRYGKSVDWSGISPEGKHIFE